MSRRYRQICAVKILVIRNKTFRALIADRRKLYDFRNERYTMINSLTTKLRDAIRIHTTYLQCACIVTKRGYIFVYLRTYILNMTCVYNCSHQIRSF